MFPDLSLADPVSSHNVTINPGHARRPVSGRGAARPRGCRRGNAGGMASDGTSPTGNRRPRRAFMVTFLLSALYGPVRGLLCALGSVDDHNFARHGGGLHAGQASIRVKASSAEEPGSARRGLRCHFGSAGRLAALDFPIHRGDLIAGPLSASRHVPAESVASSGQVIRSCLLSCLTPKSVTKPGPLPEWQAMPNQ
jgi:hypothetical protein